MTTEQWAKVAGVGALVLVGVGLAALVMTEGGGGDPDDDDSDDDIAVRDKPETIEEVFR